MDSGSEEEAAAQQASRQESARTPVAWVGGWACIVALSAWFAQLGGHWLAVSAAGALLWSARAATRRDGWRVGTAAALWLAVGMAAGVQLRVREVATGWPALQAQIETDAAASLNASLDALVDRGEQAANGAAASVGEASSATRPMFARLAELRRVTGVSAVAVLDERRVPMVWAGEHRGAIPAEVVRADRRYVFQKGPLFSYLYFARPLGNGRTAVAAMILESDLSATGGAEPFAARFARETGLTPRFSEPDRATCPSIWDWSTDRAILSVCFEALTQANWYSRIAERARTGVGLAWLLAMGLLAGGWYRRRMPAPGAPVAMATLALVIAPLGEMFGAEQLFSPVQFVLPLPWDVPLGMLLVMLVGGALWLLIRTGDRAPPAWGLPVWAAGLLAAGAVTLPIEVVRRSAAVGLRAGEAGGGAALQLATVLSIAIPLYLLLWLGSGREPGRSSARALVMGGFTAAAAVGVTLVTLWEPAHAMPVWAVAAGGVAFAFVAAGAPALRSHPPSVRNWLLAGAFAVIAALPSLWILHVQARLQAAEIELARLGTEADPFLDFLLRTFAERARHFADEGEDDVNLLYHSWVASGLAREGYEARLSIWEAGEVGTELRLTGAAEMPAAIPEAVAEARGTDRQVVARFTTVEGLHYLLLVPLPGDRVISVGVPPRSRLSRATALSRFLQSDAEATTGDAVESLYLVALPDSSALLTAEEHLSADEGRPVTWLPTETGWRSEARAHYPSGWMHVHLFVRTTTTALLLVRGALVATALVAALASLWLVARLICGRLDALAPFQRRWIGSFRGRLTLALFAFFLIPTAVFAVAAYQAVSREVIRSAAGVALRALDQTVTSVSAVPLPRLGADVGMDLLLYREGMLADASAPEALELGLFDSWLPPQIYLTFAGGEDLEDWEIRRLGENEYVVGYRRYSPDAVFAAPIPLASEEITRRQTEFRDLALFMALLGAGLSVFLALLVGRAFTRPIDQLSRAAAAIGGGNLRVQLPESRRDEFGTVYRSFNRMARRLRRARNALERETRRTETIVAEAATGVLALDPEGRVELVNPRAATILEASLERGAPLPRSAPLLSAVAAAVDEFRHSRDEERSQELDVDGRIVRLRLRRLTPSGGRRGAVVALEDVTAEIRTTRVLAWGEMARQVAHEIKNPLTPIKLAVQHLRRAYHDGRRDYGEIMDRNVDSILLEIDRLSEIARAFSRFGTPPATAAGLESVDVDRAVDDALALYRGAGGGVLYRVIRDRPEPVHAVARLGELKEVLGNLLENAREAVDGTGEIVVSIERHPHEPWVDVTVADDGDGIPPDLLPRIFEPHFSTRTSGTGLGLAIVRRLVESWGGKAIADSEPGVGTRVRIRLRATD